MKRSLESHGRRRTSWKCMEVTIIVRDLNNFGCPFANSIYLKAPFQLSSLTLKHAKSFNYVSLELLEGDIAPSVSFLENFSNLESVWFLQAEFNDSMLIMISKLILLRSLRHKCEMGNYLSEIAKTCTIKDFDLSECIHTDENYTSSTI
jgi:hypothetical protein